MPHLNQKGVAHLLLPVVLILGIIAGVYLVTSGNPLKLFSKATDQSVVFFGDGVSEQNGQYVATKLTGIKVKLTSPITQPTPSPTSTPSPSSSPTPTPSPSPTPSDPPLPNITSAGPVLTYTPWAVALGTDGLISNTSPNPNIVIRLYDGGREWGGDIPFVIGDTKKWGSFSLPADIPPSNCNIGKTCTIDIKLYNKANNTSSNTYVLTLPQAGQSINITVAGVSRDWTPWAVWVGASSTTEDTIVQIFDQGSKWGDDQPLANGKSGTGGTFSLPANSPPSNCNRDGECQVGIRLLDRTKGIISNTYSLTLPQNNVLGESTVQKEIISETHPYTASFKTAKSQAGLTTAQAQDYDTDPKYIDFTFTNSNPPSGTTETLYVEFIGQGGEQVIKQATIVYQPPASPAPSNSAVSQQTCYSSDLPTLKACFEKISAGQIDEVQITKLIDCDGHETECSFSLNQIKRPVNITGANNAQAGFKRTQNFNYQIFKIANSENIALRNLIFDDDLNQRCSKEQCGESPVSVISSKNITLDKLSFKHPKPWGISILASSNITVQNSSFVNGEYFGVWIPSIHPSKSIRVINNYFENIRSTGITIGGVSGTEDNPNLIRGNTIVHNHCDAMFTGCGADGTKLCSGGEFVVEKDTDHLIIENNVVRDGFINECQPLNVPQPPHLAGLMNSGLELTFEGLNDITIRNNTMYNISGNGIVIDQPIRSDVSNITITGNKIYNVGLMPINFPETLNGRKIATIADNCFREDCPPAEDLRVISAGVVDTYNPWLVWVNAVNTGSNIKVQLFDQSVHWGQDLPFELNPNGEDGTFRLPSNSPPSGCNRNTSCQITFKLINSSTGALSNEYTLNLPKVSGGNSSLEIVSQAGEKVLEIAKPLKELASQVISRPSPTPTSRPTPKPTVTPTLNPNTPQGRDLKRKADLVSIQKALEEYRKKTGKYPVSSWRHSTAGSSWLPGLNTYFNSKKVPQDPINNGWFVQANKYGYSYYSSPAYGGTPGSWYMLVAALEKPTVFDLSTKCTSPNKTTFNYGRLYAKNAYMVCGK